MKKTINKTQYNIISDLYNNRQGSAKLGWTLTHSRDGDYLSLQKLNLINQAIALSDEFPDLFETKLVQFRLCIFKIKDLGPIPELLNYNAKHEA